MSVRFAPTESEMDEACLDGVTNPLDSAAALKSLTCSQPVTYWLELAMEAYLSCDARGTHLVDLLYAVCFMGIRLGRLMEKNDLARETVDRMEKQ